MPVQVVKAAGFYDREIDLSVREVQPSGIPAAIPGPSVKGPAFVPTSLGSYSDYQAKFGPLDTKLVAGYGVQKFLNNKTNVVFLRLLGAGANSTIADFENTRVKGIVRNAGMQVTGTVVGGTDNRHHGAVQFITAKHRVTSSEAFGFPMFTDNDSYTLSGSYAYLVRAQLFTTYDARIMLFDTGESFGNLLDDAASIDDTSTNATYRTFKLAISSSAGAAFAADDGFPGVRIYTASLDPNSSNYISKILNSNPEKFEESKHLLYADFSVDAELATIASGSGNDGSVAVLSGSDNTSATSGDTSLVFRNAFGRFDTRYKTPRTPYFISQPFGTTEYDLFYVEAIDDGAYANQRYKISVANVKASTDPRNEFGTFTLLIRDFNDTDFEPKILEQYSNLTLDINSDNYVAKVIGDSKVVYSFDVENEDDRRLVRSGKNSNRSKLVRIVVNEAVARGQVPGKALPFGFRGPEFLNTNPLLTDSTPPAGIARLAGSGSFELRMTGSIIPPLPYRFKVTRGDITGSGLFEGQPGPNEVVDTRLYWGVKFERNNNVMNANIANAVNPLIGALTQFDGVQLLDVLVTGSSKDSFNSNKFTLARVALSNQTTSTVTASAAQHMKESAYIRNGQLDVSNYFIVDGSYGNRVTLATVLAKMSGSDFNRFIDYAKFSTIMFGGWDGVNILDRNAARFNDRATSAESGSSGFGGAHASFTSPGATPGVNYSGVGNANNAVNSLRTAVNILTDPILSTINILAIPGIRDPLVTDYATLKNDEFGLSFYLMDIPYYNFDGIRLFDGDVGQFVDVQKTADNFDARAIDNNAAAAYFPNIVIDDTVNNRRVVVPASVAALAALSFNDRVAYAWFAPAGFNRGSLDFVVLPQVRVNQPDREKMVDVRVNPVVKFPGDGYVFMSQQTLQQANTALNRINVKRMLLEVKRIIVEVGNKLIFEQITPELRTNFVSSASTLLAAIQLKQGIEVFLVICDDTNNTIADVEANRMNAQVRLVPTTAVEFILMDFIITPSGVIFV